MYTLRRERKRQQFLERIATSENGFLWWCLVTAMSWGKMGLQQLGSFLLKDYAKDKRG